MSDAIMNHPDTLNRMAGKEGFMDKTVLITGGSGFLGKVFIEKLLRTCPLVNKIYVIIRTKKGKNPQDRLKDIFDGPLYGILKQSRGEEILEKVIAISGDIGQPDLGLSATDRKLLIKEVQIIYHIAATTRFDDSLKNAVLFNTRGTKLMLELGKECKRLLMFLHCSTAYCFPNEKILYEQIYEPPADPEMIINICETMKDEVVENMSKLLTVGSPNTYSFSKALAEGIVTKEINNLPVVIMRPSVVVPIWQDPLPGWTDNFQGPVGLLYAASKGVLRTMYCNPEAHADFVSVDIVANALICGFWFFKTNEKIKVYNLTTASDIKIQWGKLKDTAIRITTSKMPFNWVVWYPVGSMETSKLVHYMYAILFHYIPAIFLDALIILTGNAPVLWKIHRRIATAFELFAFYTMRKWEFDNDHLKKIKTQLNETEEKIYKLDVTDFDLDKYIYNTLHGIRLYLVKEEDEMLPTARRRMKMMWAVDGICKMLMLFGFLYFLFQYLINLT